MQHAIGFLMTLASLFNVTVPSHTVAVHITPINVSANARACVEALAPDEDGNSYVAVYFEGLHEDEVPVEASTQRIVAIEAVGDGLVAIYVGRGITC